jgi:CO/xanthine dehydrogenase FAD-binding subunit
MEFARPTSIDEAVALLAAGEWDVLSGGTDYFPGLRDEPPAAPILDISAISDLRGIERTADGWRIGALATWSDIIRADLPPAFDGLKAASREVGSVQVQNRATLAGNLCNASPAADGVPPLLTLDAQVELASPDGRRRLPLDAFILGNRKTALAADEFVTGILVPERTSRGASAFLKLGARKYLVISIAMVAVRLVIEDGRITGAAIAVGSCSEVAKRLTGLETQVIGHLPADAAALITADAVADLSPISDVRAPAAYRAQAAVEILRRAIRMAA